MDSVYLHSVSWLCLSGEYFTSRAGWGLWTEAGVKAEFQHVGTEIKASFLHNAKGAKWPNFSLSAVKIILLCCNSNTILFFF